jgi:hypothetical protein
MLNNDYHLMMMKLVVELVVVVVVVVEIVELIFGEIVELEVLNLHRLNRQLEYQV